MNEAWAVLGLAGVAALVYGIVVWSLKPPRPQPPKRDVDDMKAEFKRLDRERRMVKPYDVPPPKKRKR
jgi:hypothetical protein